MQLILGRKFKLPVWETLIQAMALNEVSEFVVDKSVSDRFVSQCSYSLTLFIPKLLTCPYVFSTFSLVFFRIEIKKKS